MNEFLSNRYIIDKYFFVVCEVCVIKVNQKMNMVKPCVFGDFRSNRTTHKAETRKIISKLNVSQFKIFNRTSLRSEKYAQVSNFQILF